MVSEAERFADEDRQRKEKAEVRNRADSTVFMAEKSLREYGDKVDSAVKQDIEGKVSAVRDALNGEDTSRLREATDTLAAAVQQLGASMYEQYDGGADPNADAYSNGAGYEEGGSATPEDGEDVIEGEFSE